MNQKADGRLVPDPEAPRLEARDGGRFELVGDLTYETVVELLAGSADALGGAQNTVLDLSRVTRADSAGLALMVEWLRRARQRNVRIEIINMPEQMRSIARMSKLDGVLLADPD